MAKVTKVTEVPCSLNLIIGPMFSGKTTELLRIAKRLKSINMKVLMINYAEDTRYSTTEMTTHDKESMPCRFVNKLEEILVNDKNDKSIENYKNYDVFCINEAQFFGDLVSFCKEVLKNNKTVYACGLDGDYKQEKFGELIDLVPMCDTITKLHAFCAVCKNGTKAHFTKRICENQEQKLIGTKEYIPVCRKHLENI
jgi:thymidine kinase